jgi:hypothetical protein
MNAPSRFDPSTTTRVASPGPSPEALIFERLAAGESTLDIYGGS